MPTRPLEPTAQVAEQLGVEFLEFLGQGAQGTVYKALRLSDNQLVAVKAIDILAIGPKGLAAVQNELDLHSAANGSPYIVELISWYTDSTSVIWIMLELCDGGELTNLLDESAKCTQPIPETQIWMYLYQLVSAFKHCHEAKEVEGFGSKRKIVHGDVKPPNILTNKERTIVKLADFGLSVALKPGHLSHRKVGTLDYMAPELCVPNVKHIRFDASADIWSLGCIGKELCSLSPTFADNDDEILVEKIRSGKTAPIPDHYSPDLAEVLDAMLSIDPKQRPTPEDMLALPGFQLGSALTQLNEQFATIDALKLQIQEQDIRFAQSVEIEAQQIAFASALEQKQDELDTFQKQLQKAHADSKARAINLKKKEQAVRRQEEQLRQERRELEDLQASQAHQQASSKLAQSQQQAVLDARNAALEKREAEIAARERSVERSAIIRGNATLGLNQERPKTHGPIITSAAPNHVQAARDRTEKLIMPGTILAPSRKINLPEAGRVSTARNGMQIASDSKGAKEVSHAPSSAATRVKRPLPRVAPEPTTKPARPSAAVNGDRPITRSAQVAATRPANQKVAPAAKSDNGASIRSRAGAPRIPPYHGGIATKAAVPKHTAAKFTTSGSADTPQRKIRSAGDIQKTNKAVTGQALTETAIKWTTGQLRKPADANAKADTSSICNGSKAGPATKVPIPEVKSTLTSRVPPPSTWARGTQRGAAFPLTTRA